MKKKIALLLVCCLMAGCGCSCENKKSSGSGSIVAYDEIQKNGTAEEAFKDFFTANYTRDSGETAFCYMYLQQVIDNMIATGEYRGSVMDYNNGKNEMLSMIKVVPYIKSIDETTQLTEEQLGWAEQYLTEFSASMGVEVSDVHVTEGYNFRCTAVNYNEKEVQDVECFVNVEGDGWKFVSNLSNLEAMYGNPENPSDSE